MTQEFTHRFSEVHELVGFGIDTYAIGAHFTLTYRNMANHQRAVVILLVGELAAGATVAAQLWQATDAVGTSAKPIPGKAITQLSQAAGDGNDAVIIEVRAEELDVSGGFGYVGGVLTVAGNTAEIAVLGLFGCSNYVPVSTANWTEIVD